MNENSKNIGPCGPRQKCTFNKLQSKLHIYNEYKMINCGLSVNVFLFIELKKKYDCTRSKTCLANLIIAYNNRIRNELKAICISSK